MVEKLWKKETKEEEQIRLKRNEQICKLRLGGKSLRDLEKMFDISHTRIADITKDTGYERALTVYTCKICGGKHTLTKKDRFNGATMTFCSFECREVAKHKWSVKFDECQGCGTTEIPHKGVGLCVHCHYQRSKTLGETRQRRYYMKNKEKIKKRAKELKILRKLN